MQQAQQRAPQRVAGYKTARTVDRVYGPDEFSVGVLGAVLFAQDAMRGITLPDGLAQSLFDFAIGNGDGAFSRAGGHRQGMVNSAQGDGPGPGGDVFCKKRYLCEKCWRLMCIVQGGLPE